MGGATARVALALKLTPMGFDPHLALAQGLLLRFGRLVGTDPIQTGLIYTATEAAPLFARRTLRFEGAVIALLCAGSIAS